MTTRATARVAFDEAYFGRYYEDAATRVYGRAQLRELARGILGFASWWGLRVETALDVGAGPGDMRAVFEKSHKRIRYTTTDASDYACKKYGHQKLDVTRARLPSTFDLVICQGVLPYLDDEPCTRAIDNIAEMCGGFLYLEAITKHDIAHACDTTRTDVNVYARPRSFYESRLKKHYLNVGAGMYYTRKGPLVFYDLESADAK